MERLFTYIFLRELIAVSKSLLIIFHDPINFYFLPLKHKLFSSLADAKATIPISKARLLVLDGQRICLVHTAAGLFAVEDTCSHLGESLSKGTTNYLNEIVCPWHSYRFNLSTGAECKYRSRNLKTFTIYQEVDGIYIEV